MVLLFALSTWAARRVAPTVKLLLLPLSLTVEAAPTEILATFVLVRTTDSVTSK